MAKIHDRILELTVATANGAATLACTAVRYYRNRTELNALTGYMDLAFSGGAAAVTPVEITFGELCPPPTHIRFVFTTAA